MFSYVEVEFKKKIERAHESDDFIFRHNESFDDVIFVHLHNSEGRIQTVSFDLNPSEMLSFDYIDTASENVHVKFGYINIPNGAETRKRLGNSRENQKYLARQIQKTQRSSRSPRHKTYANSDTNSPQSRGIYPSAQRATRTDVLPQKTSNSKERLSYPTR